MKLNQNLIPKIMSKSNPVQLWRYGRTRALFFTQKLKLGCWQDLIFFCKGKQKFFLGLKDPMSQDQLTHLIYLDILSGLVTQRLFQRKTKWCETAKTLTLQKLTHLETKPTKLLLNFPKWPSFNRRAYLCILNIWWWVRELVERLNKKQSVSLQTFCLLFPQTPGLPIVATSYKLWWC